MTSLTNRDLLVRMLRAAAAIAAIYSFLYYLLPATTGLNLSIGGTKALLT